MPMSSFEFWKLVHITCAAFSITGLLLRAYWMFSASILFEHRLRKVLPHVVDSLLLVSAIVMLVILDLNPFAQSWLLAKIFALLAYIVSGLFLFRFAKTQSQKMISLCCAVFFAAYIVHTAFSKNPWVF